MKAETRNDGVAKSETFQFCSFKVAGRLYGVDILKVKEVSSETSFTRIHHAPPEVKGVLNIRGQIHLAIDLRALLGFGETQATADSRTVLFKPEEGEAFGFLVDSVGDVLRADSSMMEWKTKDQRCAESRMEAGACKLPKGLMVALDPAQALSIVQEKMTT